MKKIVAALLLSSAAASAFAADQGFYAGVTLGQSRASNPFPTLTVTKSTDTVYGILGGYQITKNFGAEAFFTGAGKFAVSNAFGSATGKADSYGINAVGTLPLSDAFSLYGKLGFASTKTTASSTPASVTGATRTGATYGLGGVYNATPAIGIRFGWDRYAAAVANGTAIGSKDNYNTDVYSVGAVFKF
ncbi:MAG TPA: porin family protein [Gallionella sp.]|nr:porin family protein [Gallionella sp.]